MTSFLHVCTVACLTIILTQGPVFSKVRLEVKSTTGAPGTKANEVLIQLGNYHDSVSYMQFEVCDVDNYLVLEDVLTTSRTQAFDLIQGNELDNGCAIITVASRSKQVIEPGRGPVLVMHFAVSSEAPLTEHRMLTVNNKLIENAQGASLEVTPISGGFIFVIHQGFIKKVWPPRIEGSRLKSTIHPILVIGEDTKFNFSSEINFNPRDEIECLWESGFGNYLFALIRLPKTPPVGLADIAIFTNGGKTMVNRNDVFEVMYQQ